MKNKVILGFILSFIFAMFISTGNEINAAVCNHENVPISIAYEPKNSSVHYINYCEACYKYFNEESHDWDERTSGCTVTKYCKDCGYEAGETTTHNYSYVYYTETYHRYKCSRCGDVNGTYYHNGSETCTSAAYCSTCGSYYGSALGHNYSSTITATATCTTDGTRKYTCARCDDSYTDPISATGHKYTKACTVCGAANKICSVCGDELKHDCQFTISYNGNGGSNVPNDQTMIANSSVTLSSQTPTRNGYMFKGWGISSTATEATYQPGDTYSTNANLTLYAVWELIKFDVTLAETTYTYDGNTKTPTVTVEKDGEPLTINTDYTLSYSNNRNAGTASVIVIGAGEFAGQSILKPFTINKKNITVTISPLTKEYGEVDSTFTYTFSGQVGSQVPASRGRVTRATGENIGTYAISNGTFALIDNDTFIASNYNVSFSSTTFTITAKNINSASASYKRFWQYTGSNITPDVTLKDGITTLTQGTDYTISYSNNKEKGDAKITFNGIGNYTGTKEVYFVINEYGAQCDQIVLDQMAPVISNISATNAESSVTVTATITDPDVETGVSGSGVNVGATRYAITSANIMPSEGSSSWCTTNVIPTVNVGTLHLWIMARDNVGNVTYAHETIIRNENDQYIEFVVDKTAPIISEISATMSGNVITIDATLTDPSLSTGDAGSGVDEEATRYAVTSSNVQPTASSSEWKETNEIETSLTETVYVWIMAKDKVGNTSYKSTTLTVTKSISDLTVSGVDKEYIYTGSAIVPIVVVKDGDKVLEVNTDYSITYANNTNVGTATITIKGIGYYVGTKTITFEITKAISINPSITGLLAVYDGQVHELQVTGGSGGTIKYSTSTDNATWSTWTTTKPSIINVGEIYVKVMVQGDSNHSNTTPTESVRLKITPIELTVVAGSASKVYDGTALTNTEYTITNGAIVSGQTITVTVQGTITNVGSTDNKITSVVIKSGNTNVTSNYEITTGKGTLTIEAMTSSLSVEPTRVYMAEGTTGTATITRVGDGTLSAVSSDTSIATVSLSGNTLTISGKKGGSTTITISVTGATNYTTPNDAYVAVTVYGTPSTPTITPSRTTWGNTNVTFTITGAEAPQGWQKLQYKIGNGEWTDYENEAVTVSNEGEVTVYARAVNASDSSLISGTTSFVSKVDTTAPSTTAPTASSTSNAITVVCNQKDNLASSNSGLNTSLTKYRLLAENGTTVIKDWQSSNTFSGLTVSTTYKVQTKVTDNAGNESTSGMTAIATKAAPTGTTEIVVTPSTEWVNAHVTVVITYPEIDGYTNKVYKIGTGREQSYTESFTVSENTTVTAYLKDSVGNVAASATATISNIDKIIPTVEIENVIGKRVALTLKDNQSGIYGYAITTTNTAPSTFTEVTSASSVDVTVKMESYTTYYAWAKDIAGNVSTSQSFTIAEPILMTEKFEDANTNKYVLGNAETSRKNIQKISIETELPDTLPTDAWDASKDGKKSVYAWITTSNSENTLHIAADGNIILSSGYYLFANYENCTEISGLTSVDTTRVTNMSSVFNNCKNLKALDLSSFNTSNVTGMGNMFTNCSEMETLNLGNNFYTSKVTAMGYMFSGCKKLTTLNLGEHFDTGNVTQMQHMFGSCNALTSLNLGANFNTEKVTNTFAMFSACNNLTELSLGSKFNTSKVIDMGNMFSGCVKLETLNLGGNFDTSSATKMYAMFQNCSSLTSIPTGLDMSNTNITAVGGQYDGYAQMFSGCTALTSATINSKYIGYYMFYGCNKLTDITITSDVIGVYANSDCFKYTGTNPAKLLTILDSSSEVITKTNYNWSADNRTFDDEGPEITFEYNNNTTYAKSQSVKITVTDESEIVASSLKYVWTQSTTAPTESSFGTSYTNGETVTKNTESGIWYLWAVAKDEYGNTSITSSETIYLDNALPTVTVSSSSITYGDNITLTFKDSHSGVIGYQVTLSATAPTTWETLTKTNSTSVTYKPNSANTYYVWTKDDAGNISEYATFTVNRKYLTSTDIEATLEYTTTVYDGTAKKPGVTVTESGTVLASSNYDVGYTNNTNVGDATVTITGKGNYQGTITKTFSITNANMDVTASGYNGIYDGKAHGITVNAPSGATVTYGTSEGTYTLDITPTYTNVGTYTVYYKVTRDNYSDITGYAQVKITAKNLLSSDIAATLGYTTTVYDGTAKTPGVTVTENGATLANTNYTVTYNNNTNVGDATVTITGKGNYQGTITKSFAITKRDLTVTPIVSQSKVYGTTDPTFTYTYSGNVEGQTPAFSGSLSREEGENVGIYNITQNTLTLTDNGTFIANNYNLVFTTGVTFEITKATAEITVDKTSVGIAVGSTDTITISYDGDCALTVSTPAGNSKVSASLSGKVITLTANSAGTSTITISATGGTNYTVPESKTISVTVYGVPSAPTITPSRTTWGNTNVTFTITGATAPVGGQKLQYKIGNGEWQDYQDTAVTVSTEGEVVVYARAVNASSESLVSSEVSFTSKVDTTAPSTTAPTASSTSNTITVVCNQKDNLASSNSGLNTSLTKYRLLSENGTTVIKDWQSSNTFNGLTVSTTYKVQTKVADNAGNESTSEMTTIATKEAPTGTTEIVVTPSTEWVNDHVTVVITYPEIDGYTNKVYKIGTGSEQSYTGTFTVSENTTVMAYLKDSAGNIAASATATINNIDKIIPTVEVKDVIGKRVTLTLKDNQSGVYGYAITATNSAPSVFTKVTSANSVDVTAKMETYTTYYAWAKDIAGNVSTSQSFTIAEPILMAETYASAYTNKYILGNSELSRENIQKISIETELPETLPTGAWDVSKEGNKSVYAWITTSNSENTLHIAADGNIILSSGYALFLEYANCTKIDGLENFNTSKVTSMYCMFYGCSKLTTLELGNNFNTDNVENMYGMFYNCSALTSLNLDTNFNTSKVTTMHGMFYNCSALTSLSLGNNFDTSNVEDMYGMFYQCSALPSIPDGLDLSNTNITANTTNSGFAWMFGSCKSFTSATINSKYIGYRMFSGCNKLTDITITSDVIGVYNPDTTGEALPCEAFKYTGKDPAKLFTILNSSSEVITKTNYNWSADNRTFDDEGPEITFEYNNNTTYAKSQSVKVTVTDESEIDTSSLKYVWTQSATAPAESIFDTSYTNGETVTKNTESGIWYLWAMAKDEFGNTSIRSSEEIYLDNEVPTVTVESIIGKSVTLTLADTISGVYGYAITTSNTAPSAFTEVTLANSVEVTAKMESYTTYYAWARDMAGNISTSAIITIPEPILMAEVIENVTTNKYVLGNTETNRENIHKISIETELPETLPTGAWDVSKESNKSVYAWITTSNSENTLHIAGDGGVIASNGTYLFGNYTSCTEIQGLNALDTSSLTTTYMMFSNCSSLTEMSFDNFDTGNVTDMQGMFNGCKRLTKLNVSSFDTSKVGNMSYLFSNCANLEDLDVGTRFNTSRVTNMSGMFNQCKKLATINLGDNFDTSNVTNMYAMFADCYALTSIPTGLDMSNTNINSLTTYNGFAKMFYVCSSLTSVTINSKYIGYQMFYGCNKLTDITITSDVQGVYANSDCFKYTGTNPDKLFTILNSSSEVITKTNYNWLADNRTFDDEGPEITFEYNNNTTYAKSQSVKVTVTDESEIDTSSLKYAWTQSTTAPEESSFTTSFTNGAILTKSDVSGNDWYLWVIAKDEYGNTTIKKSDAVYLDNTIPTITCASSVTYGDRISLVLRDDLSGIVAWQVTTTPEEPTDWTPVSVNTLVNISIPVGSVGTYYAWTKDKAGNVSTYASYTVNAKSISDISASLEYTTITYDGTAKTPATIVTDGTYTLSSTTDYDVQYTSNTDVGTAYVTITAKGNYQGQKTLTFTITNASMSVTATGYEGIYDGKAHGITVNAPADATIMYGETAETYTLNVTPTYTNVGTYTVYYKVTRANYSDETGSAQVKITEKSLASNDIGAELNQTSFTYNATVHTPTVIVKENGTVIATGNYTVKYEDNIDAGTATVTITGVGNYTGTKTLTFTIGKKDLTVTPTANQSKIYGEDDPNFAYTNSGTVNNEIASFTGYLSREDGEDVGTYKITKGTLDLADEGTFKSKNYNLIFTENVTFEIKQKDLSSANILINVPTGGYIYDGTPKKPSVVVTVGGEEINSANYTVTYSNNINAGTDMAMVTITAKGNYSGEATKTFSIAKRNLTVTPNANQSKVYGEQDPLYTYTYSNNVDGELPGFTGKLERNAGEDVGTYRITQGTLALSDNEAFKSDNYNLVFDDEKFFEIKAKEISTSDITITVNVPAEGYTYDGTAKEPTVIVKDGTVEIASTNYKVTYANNIKAGENTATVIVSGIGNYSGEVVKQFTIGKRNLVLTPDANQNKIYGEADPTYTYTYSNNVSGETPAFTGALTRTTGESVGNYDILQGTLAITDNNSFLKDNYNLVFTSNVKFAIIERGIGSLDITVNEPAEGYTYDGAAKEPTVTVKDGEKTLTNGTDYKISYEDNTDAGTAIIVIEGIGDYEGTINKTFEIAKKDLTVTPNANQSKIYGEANPVYTYTSNGTVSGQTVKFKGALGRESGESVGTYKLLQNTLALTDNGTFKEKNYNLVFRENVTFEIKEKAMSSNDVTLTISIPTDGYTYDGTAKEPTVTVKDGSNILSVDDYTVTYENNVDAGNNTAIVKVVGKGNYTGSKTGTFTIDKRSLNVTPNANQSKVYGEANPTYTYVYSNNVSGEIPVFTGSLSRENGENVGEYNILQGTLALADKETFKANNYSLEFTSNVKFKITAKTMSSNDIEVIVTIPDGGYIYDGTAKTPTVTVKDGTNIVGADNYTVTYENNVNAGDNAIAKVTGKENYIGEKTVTFIIAKRNLTVTPNANQSKTYGAQDPVLGYTYSNNVTDEVPKFAGVLSRDVGENIGEYNILQGTLELEDNNTFLKDNYNILFTSGVKFKINAKAISLGDIKIVLDDVTFTYDGEEQRIGVTVSDASGDLVEDTHYELEYSNNINAGENTATVLIKGIGNYTGEVARQFTIGKRNLVVTPDANQSKTYGEQDPIFTYSYSNNVSGEIPEFTGNLVRVTGETVGTYAIQKGNLALKDNDEFLVDNYNLVFTENVMFEIKAKAFTSNDINITVNVPVGGYTYDGTQKKPTVTVTDGESEVSNTNYIVTYENNINAGVDTAIVKIIGKENYIGEKTAAFTIGKRNLRVTPNASQYKIYGNSDPVYTYSYSNNVDGEIPRFTGSLTRVVGEAVGNYEMQIGTLAISDNESFLADNYTLVFTSGVAFEIKEKGIAILDITVNVPANGYTYDGNAKEPTVEVNDGNKTLILGTDYTLSYKDNTNAGIDTAIVTITGIGDYNGSVDKTFTINRAKLAVVPNANQNKVYGETDPDEYTYTYSGNVSSETPKFTGYLVRVTGESVGEYEIQNGTLGLINNGNFLADNYTLIFTTGVKFEIKSKSFTLDDIKVTVNIPANGYTYDGMEKQPTVIVKDGTKTLMASDYTVSYKNNVNAGNNAIVKVTGKGNYSGEKSETFTIGKRDLTVTPNINQEKIYGANDPAEYTYSYTNNVTLETPKFTGKLERDEGEEVGKYNITQGNLAIVDNDSFLKDNYNLVFVNGVKFTITEKSASEFTVKGVDTSYEFTNEQITPTVIVEDGTKILVAGTDYNITYGENKNVGIGTVTIEGIGNYTGTKTITFTIVDTVAPTVPSIIAKLENVSGNNYDGNWTNKNVWVQLTSTDLAGVVAYEWSTKANSEFTTDGMNITSGIGTIIFDTDIESTIYFRAKDANGNYSGTSSMVLKLDNTAPTNVSVIASATTNTITAQVSSVNGNISGVKEYEFYLNGDLKSTQEGTTYTFTGLRSNMDYTVTVKARDNAGNVTSEIGTTPVLTRTEAISSNITLTAPSGWVNTDVTITIEWPETTLIRQVKEGNGDWVEYDNTEYTVSENTIFQARLTDGNNVGNAVTLTINNIDKNKPIANVSQGSIVYGNSVTLTFTDDLSKVNGWAITTTENAPTIWNTVDPAVLETSMVYKPTAVGTYFVWAKDQATNVSDYASFEVTKKDIYTSQDIEVILADTKFTYNGTEQEIGVTVKENGVSLDKGIDYTLTYANHKDAGTTATVTVKGIGNYKGEVIKTYTIRKRTLTITPNNKTKVYGDADPVLTYTYKNNVDGEIPAFNETLSRESGEDIGTYQIEKGNLDIVDNGSFLAKNYEIAFVEGKTLTITRKTIEEMTASIAKDSYEYTGKEIKPSVTVTGGSTTIISSNYTVEYTENTDAGTATITITGTGNYEGTLNLTFEITPKDLIVKPEEGQSKIFGENDPILTYSYSGVIEGETPKFTGILARDEGEDVGIYEIKVGSLALENNGTFKAKNYNLVFSTETVSFTIIPAIRELTIDPNGGSYSNSDKVQTVQGEVRTTITLQTPVRAGFRFTGWTLTGGGSLSGNNYTYEMTSGRVTANWEDNEAPAKPVLKATIGNKNGEEYVVNTWTNQNVYIEATATDNVEVTSYKYQLNGTSGTWEEMTLENGVGSITLKDEGIVTIYVKAFDEVGNGSEVESLLVQIDKTAPTGTVVINDDAMFVNDANVILTLTGNDNLSGVEEMSISNTPEAATFEPFAEIKTWQLIEGDGQKTVYVVLKDAAGNMTSTIWE